MKRLRTNKRSEQGSAYVVVLLVLLLLTIFGLGLVVVTQTEREIGTNQRDATRAFYAADSGIAVATAWMFENNFRPHTFEITRRQVGGLVIRDVVTTTAVLTTGTNFSNLGDVTDYSTGTELVRHNYRFTTAARRLRSKSDLSSLQQLAQKRVELMIEMDPWDADAVRDFGVDTVESTIVTGATP